jgi:hypothetical protein
MRREVFETYRLHGFNLTDSAHIKRFDANRVFEPILRLLWNDIRICWRVAYRRHPAKVPSGTGQITGERAGLGMRPSSMWARLNQLPVFERARCRPSPEMPRCYGDISQMRVLHKMEPHSISNMSISLVKQFTAQFPLESGKLPLPRGMGENLGSRLKAEDWQIYVH